MNIENPKFQIFKKLPSDVSSCLYIASAGNITKVGFSERIQNRAKMLLVDLEQRSGSNFYGIAAFPCSGGYEEERGLIALMNENFEIFHGKEYFKCKFHEAYHLVESYCKTTKSSFLRKKEALHIKSIEKERLRMLRELEKSKRHIEYLNSQIEIHRAAFAKSETLTAFSQNEVS